MHHKIRKFFVVGLAVAALTGIGAGPASAADKLVHVYTPGHSGDDWAAQGSWDDSDETLCAVVGDNRSHVKAVVRIAPASGTGPVYSLTDRYPQSWICTDNLRIPEDRLYRMTVTVFQQNGDTFAASSRFYT